MAADIIKIVSLPGIARDGTLLGSPNYSDGRWVRFQRSLPRKIGGYRSVSKFLTAVPRALHAYAQNSLTFLHAGSAAKVERLTVDLDLNCSVVANRTPAALVANPANVWQFDVETTVAASGLQLVAHVAPNANDITSSAQGQLFYGGLFASTALLPVTVLPAIASPSGLSGGVFSLHPYVVVFGSEGFVMWSPDATNFTVTSADPTDFTVTGAGAAFVTSQKIVRGMPVRGGPNSPSGLLWSVDSLLRMSFVGGSVGFSFDTISAESSILSSSCVIEYDGIFYWVGADRFLQFNGVVREIENQLSSDFFFDNLNYAHRQKVFAVKVPRFGEIWWCFPFGESVEPNHAVIYNVRENSWYDTPLPNGGRGAGVFPSVFRRPLMAGSTSGDGNFRLWVHETGVDEIDGSEINPIQSFFETAILSVPVSAQVNKAMRIELLEPDFVQTGPMTVSIRGRANARAPEVSSEQMVFPSVASTPQEQVVFFKEQRRQLRFRFESNVVGGDYQMGQILAHVSPSDGTVLG